MSELNLTNNKTVVWHQQTVSEVARLLAVDPAQGVDGTNRSHPQCFPEPVRRGVGRQRGIRLKGRDEPGAGDEQSACGPEADEPSDVRNRTLHTAIS